MQADSLTLAVDTLNNGTTSNQTFTAISRETNKSTYSRSDASSANRRDLAFLRKFPTRSGNFLGATKVTFKFTDTYSVQGVDSNPLSTLLVGEVSFSIPVGVAAADAKEFRQRLLAVLDNDTVMDKLMNRAEV